MLLKFIGHRAAVNIYMLAPEESHSDGLHTEVFFPYNNADLFILSPYHNRTPRYYVNTVELGYNVIKGTLKIVSL
jgi:hypothetical protein